MASCKDCVHVEVCISYLREAYKRAHLATPDLNSVLSLRCDDCEHFKDRSWVAALPCAEWIEDEDMYGDPIYRCSNCGEHFILEEGTPTDNGYFYCPNCGAQMNKEREENA